jgi:hypothetical protein
MTTDPRRVAHPDDSIRFIELAVRELVHVPHPYTAWHSVALHDIAIKLEEILEDIDIDRNIANGVWKEGY